MANTLTVEEMKAYVAEYNKKNSKPELTDEDKRNKLANYSKVSKVEIVNEIPELDDYFDDDPMVLDTTASTIDERANVVEMEPVEFEPVKGVFIKNDRDRKEKKANMENREEPEDDNRVKEDDEELGL